MSTDAAGPSADDTEVVGSIDEDGGAESYVIADITEDGAWLSVDAEDAPELEAWR